MRQGKLHEAIKSYEKAIQLKPDYAEAFSNRGGVLQELGQLEEAVESCNKAIQLKPDNPVTYNNRGNALRDLGRLEEALKDYEKAILLNSDYAEAYNNRGHALSDLGQLNEALQSMQTAVEKDPESSWIFDSLVVFLNCYMPNGETSSPYIKAQGSLQQIHGENTSSIKITDELVRQLYQQCHSILTFHNLENNTNRSQLYRGAFFDEDCRRHKMVFDTFKIIPERCFSCYKVTLDPRTVMELFKILLLFDRLKLPNDNTRKCTVEVRPEISGTYKGFVYCKSLDEAKEILTIVKSIVGETISEEIPIFVKRGCSEFPITYPEYGHITDNEAQLMTYNEEWRKHEVYTDNNLIKYTDHNANDFTHNHSGLTLLDALIMRNWLSYAKTIGDISYLQISKSHNLCVTDGLKNVMDKRPSFRLVKKES
ncbi:MAG: tetratricopeptide repeat protein [Gammaproteobacteria bacterium]|nr:tetratricopeptide repeat protein [Gammaproteobacteria bacterium]